MAADIGADVALRIDDVDTQRYRPEYVADIFRTLHRLEVEWSIGPRSIEDFESNWSQRHHTQRYAEALEALIDRDLVYACGCSRAQVRTVPTGGCPGGCREAGGRARRPVDSGTALRLKVPPGQTVAVSGARIDVSEALGDPVIWRRDDIPAYHLVSVVEDARLGTTHIVRGEDLLASSAFQILLAGYLGLVSVEEAEYVHHPLVLGADRRKLSKSTLASPGGIS